MKEIAKIKVIGLGGAGQSAVDRMIKADLKGVEFIAMNTDKEYLKMSEVPTKIQFEVKTLNGSKTIGDSSLGKKAAEESKEEIKSALKDTDMVFIVAGLGGGTGTGAAPVIASIAREMGILTVGVVTKPFKFEGKRRTETAENALKDLKYNFDSLIVITNDKFLDIVQRNSTLQDVFSFVDEIMMSAVQAITDIITVGGIVDVTFDDIKNVMKTSGEALIGIGKASGENKGEEAAKLAIGSKTSDCSINDVNAIIMNVTGGINMTMRDVNGAASTVANSIPDNAGVIFGAVVDEKLDKDEIQVTIIATGF